MTNAITVLDHYTAPTYWQPEGRLSQRVYFDPAREEALRVQVCKKTQTVKSFRLFTGVSSLSQFKAEWSDPTGQNTWKKRAPITEHQAHILYSVGWGQAYRDFSGQRSAMALSRRGLPDSIGNRSLGDYSPGHWEGSHWEDASYWVDVKSPLVQWIAKPVQDAFESEGA